MKGTGARLKAQKKRIKRGKANRRRKEKKPRIDVILFNLNLYQI